MDEFIEEIGMSKWDLDTPALLIDLPVIEKNLKKMADFFSGKEINIRPHVKTYKATPELAKLQLEYGAIGLTCAKLSEAEALVNGGITDILIANQIVGQRKIQRLISLAARAKMMVAVDNLKNVAALSNAAVDAGVSLGALIEVNIGHKRAGVAPFEPALELARVIINAPGIEFMGLMGYDGHCTLKVDEKERESLSLKANKLLVQTKKFIEDAGISVPVVSASGTFTYRFAAEIPGITDIQAGTYLLMDTAFIEHGVREFECALSVLTTVSSRPTYPNEVDLAIIDLGRKSISPMLGIPEVKGPAGATLFSLSQEHGRVSLEGKAKSLEIGDKVEIWVRDTNGTINLFNKFYAIRNDVVEAVWRIPVCGCNT
jgi:D-serine deaminase-like pyridoxal phosphate-dependent protein